MLAVVAIGVGCGSDDGSSTASGGSTSGSGTEASGAPIKLVFGTATTNVEPSFVQAYVAVVRKYFADEGLDVSIEPFGTSLASAIARGDADFVFASAPTAFPLQQAGKKTAIVYNGAGGGLAGAVIAAKQEITDVKGCKSMISAAQGTAGYAWAVRYQSLYGAKYEIIPATDSSSLAPTVLGGRADCAIGAFSLLNPAVVAKKAHYVLDTRDKSVLPPDFPKEAMETALWGTRKRVDEIGPDTMKKVISAMQKALADVRNDSDEELAEDVHSYPGTQQGGVEQLAQSIALTKPFIAPADGFVSEDAWDLTRGFYQAGGYKFMTPDNGAFAYDQIIDMSYLSDVGK